MVNGGIRGVPMIAMVIVAPIAALMILLALEWLEARLLPGDDRRAKRNAPRGNG
jgi:hypothetical protein